MWADLRSKDRHAAPGIAHRRLVLILVAALAIAGSVLALLRLIGVVAPSGCAFAAPLGWTIPITTALVVLGVAWLLLSQSRGRDRDDDFDASETQCPSCGETVFRDWRLCPYCTTPIDARDIGDDPHPSGA